MRSSELKTNIDNFIYERIEESHNKVSKTKEYRKILNNSYNLFDKIESVVNDFSLTDNYKDAESELSFIQLKEAYKIGFKDSMKIFLYNEI